MPLTGCARLNIKFQRIMWLMNWGISRNWSMNAIVHGMRVNLTGADVKI
jgi:hypothetical protein